MKQRQAILYMMLASLLFALPAMARTPRGPVNRVAASEFFATNVLDGNNIGQFVANSGRFNPGTGEVGVTCEWPQGSGNEALYRMNMMVGIPGNVVQSRVASALEWDPQPGYHNHDLGLLAVSTDPNTWPRDNNGNAFWPNRDANGNAIFISEQDSYGVYNDSTNVLGAEDPTKFLHVMVHQKTYSWNTDQDRNYIIFEFDLINYGDRTLDSLYFANYSDFDIGGWRGLVEYEDDKIELDLDDQYWWMYDADNSTDNWEGDPFAAGIVFLETPNDLGITDFHYFPDANEPLGDTQDTELYWLMSSDERLRNDDDWPDLFHGDDPNYDDPTLIPDEGRIIACLTSSGPHTMAPGDTMRFTWAMFAGPQTEEFVTSTVDRIWEVYDAGYRVKTVPKPYVTGVEESGRIRLRWTGNLDTSYVDPDVGRNTLRGYYVYKTEDPQRLPENWERVDGIAVGNYEDPASLLYEWTDSDVTNSFYYSYAVTAFDSSGAESGIAPLKDNVNTVELRPSSAARPVSQLSDIKVVPNPFVISAAWERERLGNVPEGEPVRELSFVNLPDRATIRIYTMDGDLVKTLQHSGPRGTAYWDVRSDFNQLVASGVYFFHVDAGGEEHVGKFAIIR